MNTHEPEHQPEQEPDDDLRFAPPAAPEPDTGTADAPTAETDTEAASPVDVAAPEADTPQTDDVSDLALDIDAALAAVATLDDVLAEQEAAEQAEIARQQAETEARARRQARVQNPEMFFPMPPLSTLPRGRLDSVIPALVLIALGAWLALTLTTTRALPASELLLPVLCAALAVILLARWFASGRWARGALLLGLTALFAGAMIALLDMLVYWPLLIAAPGFALILTALLSQPEPDSRLLLPGLATITAAIVTLAVFNGALPAPVLELAAAGWPALAVLLVVILLVPRLLKRR